MKRRDARRKRREWLDLSIFADAKDGAGAISDVERPVRPKRQSRRHTKIGGVDLGAVVREQAVHLPFETARDVQESIGSKRMRCRIRNLDRQRFARTISA